MGRGTWIELKSVGAVVVMGGTGLVVVVVVFIVVVVVCGGSHCDWLSGRRWYSGDGVV